MTPRSNRIWIYQSCLQPWSYLFYPTNVIQMRTTCMPWLRPVGYDIPKWMTASELADKIQVKRVQPRLAPREETEESLESGSALSKIVILQPLTHIKTIYDEEGIFGLYRGVAVDLFHCAVKDGMTYWSLRFFYPYINKFCSAVRSKFQYCYSKLCVRLFFFKKSEDTTEVEPACKALQFPESLGTLNPVVDFTHLFIKNSIESLLYPLIVLKHRLIAYEGPELLGVVDTAKLIHEFDGVYQGFYRGFTSFICLRLLEDSTDIICLRICHHQGYTWEQSIIIRNGISTLLSTVTAPVTSLILVQSVQSTMPGLCDTNITLIDILEKVPWKFLGINLILTTFLTTFNTVVALKSASLTKQHGELSERSG